MNFINAEYHKKLKFFTIFRFILSIIYFIPSLLIFGGGLATGIVTVIASYLNGDSNLLSNLGIISIITFIPMILAIVLFVFSLIYLTKVFKNQYSKKLDLITCIMCIVVSSCCAILFFKTISLISIYLLIVSILIELYNLYFIFKK